MTQGGVRRPSWKKLGGEGLRRRRRSRYDRVALQTPEQRPEGPLPFQVPLARAPLNRPVPCAMRGPATAVSDTLPDADTRPPSWIG
jgi:hypothetical protein